MPDVVTQYIFSSDRRSKDGDNSVAVLHNGYGFTKRPRHADIDEDALDRSAPALTLEHIPGPPTPKHNGPHESLGGQMNLDIVPPHPVRNAYPRVVLRLRLSHNAEAR